MTPELSAGLKDAVTRAIVDVLDRAWDDIAKALEEQLTRDESEEPKARCGLAIEIKPGSTWLVQAKASYGYRAKAATVAEYDPDAELPGLEVTR